FWQAKSALRFSGCESEISLESLGGAVESAETDLDEISSAGGELRRGFISPNAATGKTELPAGNFLSLVLFAGASFAEPADAGPTSRAESGGMIDAASAAALAFAFAISFASACFATRPTSRAGSWRTSSGGRSATEVSGT